MQSAHFQHDNRRLQVIQSNEKNIQRDNVPFKHSIFTSVKVADATEEINRAYSFKRYLFIKIYSRMTVLPAPLACAEYILRFLRILVNYCNGNKFESYEAFAIKDIDDVVEREYLRFEEACQQKFFTRTDLDASPDHTGSDGRDSGTLNKKSFKSQGQNKGFNKVFDSIEKATAKNEWEKVILLYIDFMLNLG